MIYDKQILDEVGSHYSQETLQNMANYLKKYHIDIKKLIEDLNQWNGLTSYNKKEKLQNAYFKIMEFRSYILGSHNQIQYRLYVNTDEQDLSKVQIVNINEQNLLNIITRDRTSLRLKQNLNNIIQDFQKDTYRQMIFERHMKNILNDFDAIEKTTKKQITYKLYVVNQENVIDKYGGKRSENLSHLVYQNTASTSGKKRGPFAYTLKVFNRGWIYQAFDSTLNIFQERKHEDIEKDMQNNFHKIYFTQALKYDNTVGFKGGDVNITQIKANSASLMSKTTILKYLKIIDNILSFKTNTQTQANNVELKNYILSHFTKESDIIGETLDKLIDIKINKVISQVTKT